MKSEERREKREQTKEDENIQKNCFGICGFRFIFPLSFFFVKLAGLLIALVIYSILAVVGAGIIVLFGWIPLLGIPFLVLGGIIALYAVLGMLIAVLVFLRFI